MGNDHRCSSLPLAPPSVRQHLLPVPLPAQAEGLCLLRGATSAHMAAPMCAILCRAVAVAVPCRRAELCLSSLGPAAGGGEFWRAVGPWRRPGE